MNRRYLILALLLALMIAMPAPAAYTSTIQSTLDFDISLVETKLQMEIASDEGQGVSALLEFDDQLSASEIEAVESLGVEFVRRGSLIVNVGRIYSATVFDVDSIRHLSDLGLIRATSGSKQFVPSLTTSVEEIRADDVWNNLQTNGQTVDGSGVTVAVIDTGAAWIHPSFWKQYPTEFNFIHPDSHYYVDFNDNAVADPGEGPILTVNGQSGPLINYASDYMYISTDGTGNFDYGYEFEFDCDSCLQSLKSLRETEKVRNWLCDRIFCPAVPSLDYHTETYKDSITNQKQNLCEKEGQKSDKCKEEYK